MDEGESVVWADSEGDVFDDASPGDESCPTCGAELMSGTAGVRFTTGDVGGAQPDIDAGNKMEGDVTAKICTSCGYLRVKVTVQAYAGF
jgi:hypothetical protein